MQVFSHAAGSCTRATCYANAQADGNNRLLKGPAVRRGEAGGGAS